MNGTLTRAACALALGLTTTLSAADAEAQNLRQRVRQLVDQLQTLTDVVADRDIDQVLVSSALADEDSGRLPPDPGGGGAAGAAGRTRPPGTGGFRGVAHHPRR